MYGRRINNLEPFTEVRYFDDKYEVMRVYSHIAYLRNLKTNEEICVNLGDLVMAGLESSLPVPPKRRRTSIYNLG